MILSGMGLLKQSAHPWLPSAHNDEQIFYDKAVASQFIDNFHMGEPLPIGAYFILTFDDVNASLAKHSVRLSCGGKIQIEHCFMILFV